MPTESIPRRPLVEVRRGDLQRVGQIDERDIESLKVEVRRNNVGSWELAMPDDHPAVAELRVPGAGLIVTLDDEVLLSGPLVRGEWDRKARLWDFQGVDDSVLLADRAAYPNPASAFMLAQQGQGGYDVRTGVAESVMRAYVAANMGALAPSTRQVPGLLLAPDEGRGQQVTGRARFQPLGDLLRSLAALSGLGYRIRAEADHLLFEVTEGRDLTRLIRFDVDDDTADEAAYSFEAPELTRAIVAGQGQAEQRLLIEQFNDDSLAAEVLWGRRREVFIDRRDVSDQENGPTATEQLRQAGDEALVDGGSTRVGLTITPVDTPRARFWSDWRVGDRVSATVGDVTVTDVVSEAAVSFGTAGLTVTATLGDPEVAARRPVLQVLAEQRRLRYRTGRLERQ